MKKRYSRLLILGLMLFLASIAMLQGMFIVSCFFSGIFGCLVGIIAMKGQKTFEQWKDTHFTIIDMLGVKYGKSNKEKADGKDNGKGSRASKKSNT